jgi:hypothetical protein
MKRPISTHRSPSTAEEKMDKKSDPLSTKLTPLSPKQVKVLDQFAREMTEDVIPDIVEIVEKRRVLASQSRRRPLKR